GVAGRDADVERAAVVSVHDPTLTRGELGDARSPLGVRRRDPSRMPIMRVEMGDGQSGPFAERDGERRFPAPSGSDHENAAHVPIVVTISATLESAVSTTR